MGSQPCLNSKMGTVGAAFIAQWIFVRLLSCGLGSDPKHNIFASLFLFKI